MAPMDSIDSADVIALVKDILNEMFDDDGELNSKCITCPMFKRVADFASKIVKLGVQLDNHKLKKLHDLLGV